MPSVRFLPENTEITVNNGTTLLEAAKKAQVTLSHSCGGQGMCTSCRVIVQAGEENLSRVGRNERDMLTETDLAQHHRLACQTLIQRGTAVIETRS